MKINHTDNGINITGASFGNIKMSWGEFWHIVNHGDTLSAKNEIKDYLEYLESDEYINPELILNSDELLDDITEQLLDVRCESQSGDQMYDVIRQYMLSHRNVV